jgi:glycosyltransferase involved in cell wall biosynthesis
MRILERPKKKASQTQCQEKMKRILMIAFHYPPFSGGSGIHRTLKFSRYLPIHGWQPIILTANPRAYPRIGNDQLGEIPTDVPVKRVFAWDTARHLSFRGSYLRWMALPDRWISWWLGAVPAGLRLFCQYRPNVIWSTYPIATAHLISLTLHRLVAIPWIADFRDSMTEEEYPSDPVTRRVYRWIERLTVQNCTQAVFTTPGTLRMYAERYPEIPRSRWAMIPNGYDEENFIGAEQMYMDRRPPQYPIVLVHSGLIYPSERDPRAFFAALAHLREAGEISSSKLKIILRGSGSETYYRKHVHEIGIEDIVFLEPAVPYREALVEMLNADGLLIFQAANCNHQIPAKLYEYLRARRPIFALTDPAGDTAGVLKAAGIDTIAPLDSKEQIAHGLLHFLKQVHERRAPVASDQEVKSHSREFRAQELARLLDSLTPSTRTRSVFDLSSPRL